MASSESCGETKLSTIQEEDKSVIKLMQRAQWLRAAILGANDGLLSTTSLMLGVGAAKEDQRLMIVSGFAGALAGACSMAVGEFVSVSTQRDIEQKTREISNLEDICRNNNGVGVQISVDQSTPVDPEKLGMNGEPKGKSLPHVIFSPHRSPLMNIIARDEGLNNLHEAWHGGGGEVVLPNPYKAAVASGVAFLCGSVVPILSAMVFSRHNMRVMGMVVITSIALAASGAVGARLGGSPVSVSAMRVLVGGWISMAVTYGLLKPLDRDDNKVRNSDH